MGVTLYMSGKAKKLKTLPQLIEDETTAGIKRGMFRLRYHTTEEFARRGIGRALFGKKITTRGMKSILFVERVVKRGDEYSSGIQIKGLAALVAQGGKSKAHGIGSEGKVLFNPRTGFTARGRVDHPGSRFRRDDFHERAMSKAEFRPEVEKGLAKVAAAVNRG